MTKIYYFSATGNSLWSAKKIAQIIAESNPARETSPQEAEICELHNIGIEAQQENIIIEADAVIFVFPSYAYGMPLIVRHFVKKAKIKTPYAASLVTFGTTPRGTLGSILKILKKKDIGKMFFEQIPAVENYLAIFGTQKAETINTRCEMQEKATEEMARSIIERKENKVSTFSLLSLFVYSLFSLGAKIFYNFYQVSKKCTGCGICEKICPVAAIVMKDGRPRFTSKCEHCQGCINLCPLRAIQFSRVRFGSPGYCRPGIQISDLKREKEK